MHHLLDVLQRLTDGGNTVVVIEHHLDVIKTADHVIDLGPYGGDRGGELLAEGTPEDIARNPDSATGRYILARLLEAAGTLPEAGVRSAASAHRRPASRRPRPPSLGSWGLTHKVTYMILSENGPDAKLQGNDQGAGRSQLEALIQGYLRPQGLCSCAPIGLPRWRLYSEVRDPTQIDPDLGVVASGANLSLEAVKCLLDLGKVVVSVIANTTVHWGDRPHASRTACLVLKWPCAQTC